METNINRHYLTMKRVQEHYDYLIAKGYNVAFVALQGSQNYGLDIYTETYCSDVDTKAVVLPTLADVASGRAPLSTVLIMDNDEHIDVKDIRCMVDMWKKQNISYLEILFTEYIVVNPKYESLVASLHENADRFGRINNILFFKAIKGMAYEKQKALCHPYPNTADKIAKFGYDPKQLHHIIRLYEMVERLGCGESLRECWKSNSVEELASIKMGNETLETALAWTEKYIGLIAETCDKMAMLDLPIDNGAKETLDILVRNAIERSIRIELGIL